MPGNQCRNGDRFVRKWPNRLNFSEIRVRRAERPKMVGLANEIAGFIISKLSARSPRAVRPFHWTVPPDKICYTAAIAW
jgi:hypothetical protein